MKFTLVATPIGNDSDITLRALESLKSADLILAEDTRVTKKLLERLSVDYGQKKFTSFHDHKQEEVERLSKEIHNFKNVCLVSDAGSPIISDPAYPLLRVLVEQEVEFDTASGISSVICALELSGLPSTPFTFHGFLPRKEAQIENFVGDMGKGTHVFFESPHRIIKTLEVLKKVAPLEEIAICRELTKTYQTVTRSKLEDLELKDVIEKGEFVLVLYKSSDLIVKKSGKIEGFARDYLKKPSRKKISKLLSEILGEDVKEIYSKLD